MTNLNSRSVLHPRWRAAVEPALAAFEKCMIAIFDPQNYLDGPGFDPYTNNKTARPKRVWTGPAQMQVYRQSLTVDDVSGSVTQLRSVRFTLPFDDTGFIPRKGMIVRVTESDGDPANESYEFIVTSGLNSPLAFKRTIEAEVDMAVLAPAITEYD